MYESDEKVANFITGLVTFVVLVGVYFAAFALSSHP